MAILGDRWRSFETATCLRFNQTHRHAGWGAIMRIASRLGDGWVWAAAVAAVAVAHGDGRGLGHALLMLVAGALATALYRAIKGGTRRPRPSAVLAALSLSVPPLDRFSFPSGHTLHAVLFTVIAWWSVPWLGAVLAPCCLLVATSRLVLGLHWPSDVLAGAAIGGGLAASAIALAPCLGLA